MRRKTILALVCTAMLLSGVACQDNGGADKAKVSFVQDGQKTVVKMVEYGQPLLDIPTPATKEGYTIVWDVTDFSAITDSITVNAIETPNTYLITYQVEEEIEFDGVNFSVSYGADFQLATPKLENRTFAGWKILGTNTILQDGKYLITNDVTLIPTWSVENDDEFSLIY